jgi:hypothetical protein
MQILQQAGVAERVAMLCPQVEDGRLERAVGVKFLPISMPITAISPLSFWDMACSLTPISRHRWDAKFAEHGGPLIPLFALAHENDPDPTLRPYQKPITAEKREELIAGAAAGVMRLYQYFEASRLLGTSPDRNQAQRRPG